MPQLYIAGSWEITSKVISTLSRVVSTYKYGFLTVNPEAINAEPQTREHTMLGRRVLGRGLRGERLTG